MSKMTNRYYSKKDLCQIFQIADTTVYRTLKACGLSTGSRRYSPEDISYFFIPARKLFSIGYSVRQVEEYFRRSDSAS
jgi:DNA-binding transcriptional MerR regulator